MKTQLAMVLAVLVLITATTANAQTELAAASLGTQLAMSLESTAKDVRAQTLHQISEIAAFNPEFDLTATVPALVEIYRSDPDDQYRLMAVGVLHQIGDEAGMQKVREHVAEQRDRRVQVASIAAVRETFGLDAITGDREILQMARHLIETM